MIRRKFLISSGALLGLSLSDLLAAEGSQKRLPYTKKMPVLFVGHGSPMNAITKNHYHQKWQQLGKRLTMPSAILVVSAHWNTRGTTQVMVTPEPETIHDFGGFPAELFDQDYPVRGHRQASLLTHQLLQASVVKDSYSRVILEHDRGIDHGTWSVLLAMYPEANIPVLQLSIDQTKPAAYHYAMGQQLAALRERGVLIMGSGNMVHNLYAPRRPDKKPYEWALALEQYLSDAMATHQDKLLVEASGEYPELMQLAHPTLEHYIPLLYALGAKSQQGDVEFFNTDFSSSAIAMRSVIYS